MSRPPIGTGADLSGLSKIDSASTEGLDGTENSLAYRLEEIEKHFHGIVRWFGSDGDGTGSTANNLIPWQLTAGAIGVYGTEVQLLGPNDISASDLPVTPVKFDSNKAFIVDSSQADDTYMIQIWAGTSTFGEAELVAEEPYRVGSNIGESVPIDLQMGRQPVANKLWARCKCTTASATIDLILGIHAYKG